jgi:hypothetical protein
MTSQIDFWRFPPGDTHYAHRSASLWRIQIALTDSLRTGILGTCGIRDWLRSHARARRHFYDTPRKREKQIAAVLRGSMPGIEGR